MRASQTITYHSNQRLGSRVLNHLEKSKYVRVRLSLTRFRTMFPCCTTLVLFHHIRLGVVFVALIRRVSPTFPFPIHFGTLPLRASHGRHI